MRNKKIKVYYMGAGMISIEPLKALLNSSSVDIVGIATQPDKPAGRKKKLMPTPLGLWADENDVALEKPSSVNTPEFLELLNEKNIDLIFVASFGQIMKTPVLNLPNFGCVNLHASLLPAYRGASPIAAAILDLQTETGISFMKMDEGLDTGPVYCTYSLPISGETAPELEYKLSLLGAEHIVSVLEKIIDNKIKPETQPEKGASYAGKIKKADGAVNWNDSAEKIDAKVRAYYPWPGAHFSLKSPKKSINLTITKSKVILENSKLSPGSTVTADKKRWVIACSQNCLELVKVKPEGKNEMTGAEFVRGRPQFFDS